MFVGTPTPIAAAPSRASALDDAPSSSRSASSPVEVVGLDRALERRAVARRRRPARIFVPPTSTPMTSGPPSSAATIPVAVAVRTSRTASIGAGASRGGCRRERRARRRTARRTRRPRPYAAPARRRSAAGAAAAVRIVARRPRSSCSARLVWAVARLPRVPKRRRGRERPARARRARALAPQDGLLLSNPTTILAARHRRRRPPDRAGPRPLRLDHARAHRPGRAPHRLPLDPARPARGDSRAAASTRSTPPTQFGGAALAIRTVADH